MKNNRTIHTFLYGAQYHHAVAEAEMLERGWHHAFRIGAQHCREVMAAFVEQGGDTVTAASIRANWNPEWGTDPGPPSAESE